MFIKNSISGIAGFLDVALVPIKSALAQPSRPRRSAGNGETRKIALIEDAAGGIFVEKLLFSGHAGPARSKAAELIRARRKIAVEGFPLEEVAAWCFTHNYRWRFHSHSSSPNTFILEPGKDFQSDAKGAGA